MEWHGADTFRFGNALNRLEMQRKSLVLLAPIGKGMAEHRIAQKGAASE